MYAIRSYYGNELALTWVDNIASETGYVIERTSEKQADWEFLANTDANVSKYRITSYNVCYTKLLRL